MTGPRRSPNFLRFILTGALIGFAVGGLVGATGDPAPGYGVGTAVAYLGVGGAALGAMLAAVLAVLLDRRR